MADVKISALPAATTPLAGTEVLPIVQSGVTDKVTVANLTAGRTVAAATLNVDANSATAAVRITQTGAGNALLIEDSASPDATPFVVDASGNVGVGTALSNGQITNGYDGLTKIGMSFDDTSTTGTTQAVVFRKSTNTQVGSILTSPTSTSYVTVSDYRLKENVIPLTNAIARVQALKPVCYDWANNKSVGEGFIAHELQSVIPLAVTGEKDAVNQDGSIKPQGVDYSKIVVHLVAAVQELKAEFDAYKAAHS